MKTNSKFAANLFKSCGLLMPFVVVSCGEQKPAETSTQQNDKNEQEETNKKPEATPNPSQQTGNNTTNTDQTQKEDKKGLNEVKQVEGDKKEGKEVTTTSASGDSSNTTVKNK